MPLTPPPPIFTDARNPFAHDTFKRRIPAIVRETLSFNSDYHPSIVAALEAICEDIVADRPIPPLAPHTPDFDAWMRLINAHQSETWLATEFWFGEVYHYRRFIDAVRWWETGRDPFAPRKREELASPALWATLDQALAANDLPPADRLHALLHLDLWGNRIDLSFAASMAHGQTVAEDDLLVDDSHALVEYMLRRLYGERAFTVHIVTDNTGTELAMDWALADALLDLDPRAVVHACVKFHPTYVSDAIPADGLILIEAMRQRPETAVRACGERLHAAFEAGRLRLHPDLFWNRAEWLWDLAPNLQAMFSRSDLVLIKGDANYRRCVGDALWEPETSYAEVMAYFPAPVANLRTLKSDTIVGLPHGVAERLQASDPAWRVNGRRGVIQAANLG